MIEILKNVANENRELSPIMDRKSVLKEFNISESTFSRWANLENFPKIKINRRVFVKRVDLNNWLENYKTLSS